ncbi:peroxisomal membrane protein 11C isoform X2 [Pithys albifrons albifrons]|uniref:peroxisomal membrane protein 11C isoform X2 n=1 Tax=Pithys albifrons albifrons TaxID=3385563 RepID=UPI003A5CE65C
MILKTLSPPHSSLLPRSSSSPQQCRGMGLGVTVSPLLPVGGTESFTNFPSVCPSPGHSSSQLLSPGSPLHGVIPSGTSCSRVGPPQGHKSYQGSTRHRGTFWQLPIEATPVSPLLPNLATETQCRGSPSAPRGHHSPPRRVPCADPAPQDEDLLVRGLSVLCNVANQLYYPCEHLAWAADVGIVRAPSRKWWTLSTALWGCALLLGMLRSLRVLCQLKRKLRQHKSTSSPQSQQQLRAQVKAELLSILTDAADLSNAIHWLPPGFLWAGRFPPWLVGLLGTISSLIGIYQASRGGNN